MCFSCQGVNSKPELSITCLHDQKKKKKPTRLPDIEKRVVVAKGEVEEERIGIWGLAEANYAPHSSPTPQT